MVSVTVNLVLPYFSWSQCLPYLRKWRWIVFHHQRWRVERGVFSAWQIHFLCFEEVLRSCSLSYVSGKICQLAPFATANFNVCMSACVCYNVWCAWYVWQNQYSGIIFHSINTMTKTSVIYSYYSQCLHCTQKTLVLTQESIQSYSIIAIWTSDQSPMHDSHAVL